MRRDAVHRAVRRDLSSCPGTARGTSALRLADRTPAAAGAFERHEGLREVGVGVAAKSTAPRLDEPARLELGLLEVLGPEIGERFAVELAVVATAGDLGRERRLPPEVRVGLFVRCATRCSRPEPMDAARVVEVLDRRVECELVGPLARAERLGELHVIVGVGERAGCRRSCGSSFQSKTSYATCALSPLVPSARQSKWRSKRSGAEPGTVVSSIGLPSSV